MAPKRRASGPAAKAQSTLAFHGASNKVTKAGQRVPDVKNSLVADTATKKDVKPEIVHVDIEDEPTNAEAAIVEQTVKEVAAQQVESSPEEDAARRISDAQIKKYWAAKEKLRVAPRVHQADLDLHEKLLREFDVTGHYGPCIGIARLKRWKRAHRLDLDPPIEVLAVLLKEMDNTDNKDKVGLQRSHVDELLNTKSEVDL